MLWRCWKLVNPDVLTYFKITLMYVGCGEQVLVSFACRWNGVARMAYLALSMYILFV